MDSYVPGGSGDRQMWERLGHLPGVEHFSGWGRGLNTKPLFFPPLTEEQPLRKQDFSAKRAFIRPPERPKR